MTTTVSTNLSPFITFVEQASTPATPSAGNGLLYRKTDNAWYFLDDGGVETAINTGAASGYVLQALADAKGDLIVATAANTFAKHTAPANGSHLVADSSQSDGWSSVLHKYAATAAPGVTNDIDEGYTAGSFWFDTTNDKAYVCLDNTDGAAVWTEITGGGDITTAPAWAAAGDLIVADGNDSAAVLSAGDEGDVLTIVSGVPAWAPPMTLPADVPGLAFWLDADAITGLSDGNEIVLWPNSAPGLPSFDAIASGNPTYQTNERNGKPIVRLDGSDYFKATIPALTAPGVSIFVVFKLSSLTPAYSGILGFGRWYASSPFISEAGGYFIKSNGKSALYPGAGTSYDGTGAITFGTTNWNYVSLIFGPTTYSTRRNGSADVSGTTWNYGLLPELTYIGNQAVSSRVMTGDIAEVLIYGRPVTSTERDAIESYLVTKWGF